MVDAEDKGSPTSPRTTVRRGAKRAEYKVGAMREILRAGSIAHVAVVTEDGPLALPMIYGIGEGVMYLHGALANSLLKAGANADICATVTILDGLVFAKTPFNHSMNYRSVVVRGTARIVTDELEVLHALQLMTDHVVPTWDTTRSLSASEIKSTRVIALPLNEMSAKVRTGGAINIPEDESAPYWSGFVPVTTVVGVPVANEDSGAAIPDAIRNLEGRDLHR